MNAEELNKLVALKEKKDKENIKSTYQTLDTTIYTQEWIDRQLSITPEEVQQFEENILSEFTEKKINDLVRECRHTVLYNIVTPLGLGKLVSLGLFGQEDKLGGNVDTIHNVRQKDKNGKWKPIGSEEFQSKYQEEVIDKPYDKKKSAEIHSDKRYIEKNKEISKQRKAGEGVDAYRQEKISINESQDLDHDISGKESYDDPGRVLAGIDTKDLVNDESNLFGTSSSINRSKKDKTMSEFIKKLNETREKRQEKIQELKNKEILSDKERKELNKLEKLEQADVEAMAEIDKKAREQYNKTINKTYYTSKEFHINLAKTSSKEAVKMGLQQAIGLLLVDISNAFFDELLDCYKNGFIQGTQEETFYKSLVVRLKNIAETISNNWKNLVKSFRDGAISGFLSNIITTLINTFLTTAKNIVRIIREGTKVLFDTAKCLLFPEKGVTCEEKWDNALKILVTGAWVLAGISLQEVLESYCLSIFPDFSITLATIISGIITGLGTTISLYAIQKWDPFGARDLQKRKILKKRIQEIGEMHRENLDKICKEYGIE